MIIFVTHMWKGLLYVNEKNKYAIFEVIVLWNILWGALSKQQARHIVMMIEPVISELP